MMVRRFLGLTAVAIAMTGVPSLAQTADENRDADGLAADMRILAANPLDIEALIVAGELTLKMGDNTAAAGFFTRAEKLDPLNPRIKAGWGSLMIRAERPGEALRRFQEAAARGLDPRKFVADRGLAFDLIGEQDRAQRDYRLAIQAGANDEILRRYALSLGISGNMAEALKQLDPLLRRSDRAAWRDRAFILAMAGDIAGAQKIADTMMSPGLGRGLSPFFQRLPMLSPADRAFAVTFGELRSTPERVADARMVPPLPKLGPDPYAPKTVAAADPVVLRVIPGDDRKRKKKKNNERGLAPAVPSTVPAPPPEIALTPPPYVALRPAPAPVVVPPPRIVTATPAPRPAPVMLAEVAKPASRPLPAPVEVAVPKPTPPAVVVVAAPPPATSASAPASVAAPTPLPPPESVKLAVVDPQPTPVADQPSAAEAGVSPSATARFSEDTVLAKIIAAITVPASELGVAPMPVRVAPPPPAQPLPKTVGSAPERGAKPVDVPKPVTKPTETKPSRGKSAKDGVASDAELKDAQGLKSAKVLKGKAELVDAKAKTRAGRDARDDEVATDKNGCPLPTAKVKAAAKGRAPIATPAKSKVSSARGKALDAKCKTADAKNKDKAEPAKGDPARVWVQVAGGANEASLERAWAGLKVKAPDLFRNRQGWATPLRNTNRVLTGPFKSADEAQAFVNQMSKSGLSGFVFTSAKGQKIERLGSK